MTKIKQLKVSTAMTKRLLISLLFLTGFWTTNSFGQITVTASAGATGSTYTTLGAALAAVNAGTHQGTIVIDFNASTNEGTTTAFLNASGAGSASYTSILIEPVNDNITVTGTGGTAQSLVLLNGADNVTINGDNPNTGGINRNFTFISSLASTTTTGNTVVRLGSAPAPGNGADNNSILNCNIKGPVIYSAAATTSNTGSNTFGIFAGLANSASATAVPTTVPARTAGAGTYNNLVIQNNQVTNCSNAIFIAGSANTTCPGLNISSNIIGSATLSDYVYCGGIFVSGSTSGIINNNTILNIICQSGLAFTTTGVTLTRTNPFGILLGAALCTSVTVSNNNIQGVNMLYTGGYGARGIMVGGGNNHLIYNNMISNIKHFESGSPLPTYGATCIYINAGTGISIVFNSLSIQGAYPGGSTGAFGTTCLYIASTASTGLIVKNNIYEMGLTGSTGGATCVQIVSGGTSAMNLVSNNNAYFLTSTGSNAGFGVNGSTVYTTFATLQTYLATLSSAANNDNASVSFTVAASFISTSNLHINTAGANVASLFHTGSSVAGITTDIDGTTRNNPPNIGAHEFSLTPCSGTPNAGTAVATPSTGCPGTTSVLTASSLSSGTTGLSYQWQSSLTSGSGYSNVVGGSGANTPAYTTAAITSNTYFICKTTCANGGGTNQTNEVSYTLPSILAPTATNSTECSKPVVPSCSVATANGTPTPTFKWYSASSGGTLLQTSTSTTYTSSISVTTTFYVSEVISGCETNRTAVTATLPTVVSDPVNNLICSAGGSVQVTAPVVSGATYTWTGASLDCYSCQVVNATPTTTTVYTLNVTAPGGCVSNFTINVGVISGAAVVPTANPDNTCYPSGASTIQLNSNLSAGNFGVATITYAPANPVNAIGAVTSLVTNGTANVTLSGGSLDDGGWGGIPIGFNYNFFGASFSSLAVGTNGLLMFGTVPGYSTTAGQLGQFAFTLTPQVFPNVANPGNVIAWLANDMIWSNTTENNSLKYWNEGIAPTRRFILEAKNIRNYNAAAALSTVQVILYETTGIVEVHVTNAAASTPSTTEANCRKTIGLQDATQTIGATAPGWSARTAIQSTPVAFRFSPPANYTYLWSPSAGLSSTTANTTNYNVTGTGSFTYTLTVTNPTTGCLTDATVNFNVVPSPSAPTITPPSATINAGDAVSFTATGDPGATFNMYDAPTGGTLLFSGPAYSGPGPCITTTFYVEQSNGGCTSTRTAVTITVNPITAPTISGNLIVCGQSTTTLTSSALTVGTNSIKWYDAPTGGTLVNTGTTFTTPILTTSKTYYVDEENATCSSARTAVTVTWNTPPTLAIYNTTNNNTNDVSFCGTSSVPVVNLDANFSSAASWASNGATYSWSQSHPGGLSCSGTCSGTNSVDLNNIIPAFNNEHIILTVSDPVNNCIASTTVDITAFTFPAFNATATPSSICIGQSANISAGVSASNFAVSSITYGGMAVPGSGVTTLSEAGVNIVTPSTISIALDDQIWGSQPIGFNFNFFGNVYNTVNISSNGNLQFTTSNTTFTPGSLPNTSVLNFIAPFWTDLYLALPATPGYGIVRYWTSGFSPNRIFVCDFTNVGHYNIATTPSAYFSGQVWMYETTGLVEVHLGSVTGNGSPNTYTWSTGVNNLTGSIGAAAPNRNNNEAGVYLNATNEGWRFTPPINYNFAWTSVPAGFTSTSGTPSVSPTVNTQYNVLVTDPVTGCTKTDNVSVTVNPLPAISVSPTSSSVCSPGGTPSALTASGDPATYTWNPTAGLTPTTGANVSALPATTTTYTVTATSAYGCTSTATTTVNVTAGPNVSATATPNSVCSGADVQLSAIASAASPYCTATGGTGTYYMNDFSTTGGITNITNNSSGYAPSGYGNYTSMSASQAVGSSVTWSASNFTVGTYGVAIFIDYNQNGSFADAGEQVYNSAAYVTSATSSFTVPAGAYNGTTRMRVVVDYLNTTPGACDVSTSHETEDYAFIVTGGVPNNTGSFTYDWSANSIFLTATNIANPLAQNVTSSQTYTVTVTDQNSGCANTQTVPVTTKPLPDPSANSNAPICEGNPLGLTSSNNASGQSTGNSYAWSGPSFASTLQNPSVTGTASLSQSGTYTVTITNSFGCTAVTSTLVAVNANPTGTAAVTGVSCVGLCDGGVVITPTAGLAPYIFTDGVTVNTDGVFTNAYCEGPASVDIFDDNGCTATIPFSVGHISSAPVTLNVAFPTVPAYACSGNSIAATTNAVNLATTYTWDGPAGTTFNSTGNPYSSSSTSVTVNYGAPNGSGYNICVQAGNGCGSTNRRCSFVRGTVNVPGVITPANNRTTECASTSANYSIAAVGGATGYTWSMTGNATVVGSGTSATVNFGAGWTGGTLSVTANTPCFNSAPRSLALSNATATPGAISGSATACPGSGVTYSVPVATGAATYNWVLPANTTGSSSSNSILVNFLTGFTFGDIKVSITSICGVTSVQKIKTVSSGLPAVPPSISGNLSGLCGQTVVYSCPSVSGASSYTWTTPGTINSGQGSTSINASFASFVSGNVCVTANNSCGSGAPRCVPVAGKPTAPPVITYSPNPICANQSGVDLQVAPVFGTTGYVWTFPAGVTPVLDLGNEQIVNWGATGGVVTVTVNNACGNSTKNQTVVFGCREIAPETEVTMSEVMVYPNPAHDRITVQFTATEKTGYVLNLLDLSGRVISTANATAQKGINTSQVDLSQLAKGVYMIDVKSDLLNKQIRLVVE